MEHQNNQDFILIPQLSNQEEFLNAILNSHAFYMKSYNWFVIWGLVFAGIITLHNVLFAGNRYTIKDYNTIKYGMLSIYACMVFVLIVIIIIGYSRQSKVRKLIKETALSNNFEYQDLRNEINMLIMLNGLGTKI